MVEAIRSKVAEICEPLGHKVYAIVNYEGFVLERDVEDAYVEMVKDVVERYYLGVMRFTTSSFMLPRVITHTENEVFHSLQKGMFLFNLIGLVIEPHVFHRSTLLSCDCLHDQVSNGLASGISRVAQRCSYEGRGRTVGKVDSVHVDGKYIERTLVEGAIGVVECAECPCHSVAIKVSHRFVEKGLSFCGVGARGQARTIRREHEDSCAGAAKHCSESHGRLLLGCKAEAKLEQSVARKLGLLPRTSGLNISTAVRKKAEAVTL